jgi:hypothetical protein
MSPIRQFEADDLPQVTALYERVIRSGRDEPAPLLADYFRRTFLDHPWVDPQIPSLVYEEPPGRIVGFLGSHVRRLRFRGEPIRLACSGQLVTAPEARRAAPGAFLLREYMSGPQDLTNTDGANDAMLQLWPRLGAEVLHLQCLDWFRVFRPASVAAEYVLRGRRALAAAARPLTAVVDGVARRFRRGRFSDRDEASTTEPLTPEKLVEHLPALAGSFELHPDYDEDFARWLFRELLAVESRGRFFASLVRDGDGSVLGWYIAYARPGLVSDVVQVAAVERCEAVVLDQLFRQAQRLGVSAVRGRLEPRLVPALWQDGSVLRYGAGAALAHSRNPEILRALRDGSALMTRLEGEWWMGHHLEPFETAPGAA